MLAIISGKSWLNRLGEIAFIKQQEMGISG